MGGTSLLKKISQVFNNAKLSLDLCSAARLLSIRSFLKSIESFFYLGLVLHLSACAIDANIQLPAQLEEEVLEDPCLGNPTPGTVCSSGAIFLGTLSPGATSGSGTDRYMTTPGGCSDIPAVSVSGGSGTSSYANSDFTPASCSGDDTTRKSWNDGSSNWYDIPNLTNYTSTTGLGNDATNTDDRYGNQNALEILMITDTASGGYHAAARYCDSLVYGGYSDWYLPNRYELNLMWVNRASIPGLVQSGTYYWSSTEYTTNLSWIQRFSDGFQNNRGKAVTLLVRCVRRF